jgi:hypothetical protein
MRDESKAIFAILCHNLQSGEPFSVVDIVRGVAAAEQAVERHDRRLPQKKRDAGWEHVRMKTTILKLGTDPKLATRILSMESRHRAQARPKTLPAE